ncbi:MAG: hypothetical protein ACI97N_002470, partial [Cognaticolwellia sp.]
MRKMNKKVITELYWLAEDLLAYTDLTMDRFDIENAQNRLWKMRPILSQNDLPNIQKLYDEMTEQLEVSSFFKKADFAENV